MTEEYAGVLAALGAFAIVFVLIGLVLWILTIIANWKIFTKAGKPGWHSIIPILNIYDMYDFSWDGKYGLAFMGSYVIMTIISSLVSAGTLAEGFAVLTIPFAIAVIVLGIMGLHKMSLSFGHGVGFTLGLIFLSTIFCLILGFGSDEYIGRGGDPNDRP